MTQDECVDDDDKAHCRDICPSWTWLSISQDIGKVDKFRHESRMVNRERCIGTQKITVSLLVSVPVGFDPDGHCEIILLFQIQF